MARIQDIKQFEELIWEVVDEYLQERDCYDNPKLAIYREDGEHHVLFNDPENLSLPDDSEVYPMEEFIRDNGDGTFEPEGDRISQVANEWVFLDH